MEFLFKDRGSGKRAIKPSKEAEVLEALIPDHESDDSDFEVDKHGGGDNSDENDSDDDKSNSEDGSDASDSDADSGNNDSPDEDEVLKLKSNLTTEELINLARRQTQLGQSQGGESSSAPLTKVCGTCLGTHSDHTNEIVECDGCGVSVHESCYGIQETGSVASNASSACTEPWFCEPCMAGVSEPECEVCPNIGGIYKETDTGSWIHLVCGLYIPHISFFDQERITRPTLFELNYQSWGRRACVLCKNIKFARTGVCIECDAGMCKSYFHVTCAQEAGLLSEPSEDDHEQFFGHCKAHSDKEQIRRRRKNWYTHQLNYRQRGALIQAEREADKNVEKGQKETPSQRNLRKLGESRTRWVNSKQKDHWMPTQKMSRLLLTSSKAIKKFQKKAALHEWDMDALEEEEHNKQVVADIRKKWHVTPAWNVEFVAYYHDRNTRIKEMQENLAEAVMINNQLKEEDEETCTKYRDMVTETDKCKQSVSELKKIYKLYKDILVKYDPLDRALKSPNRTKTPIKLTSPKSVRKSLTSPTPSSSLELHTCRVCGGSHDQHHLTHCDICTHSYHINCLSPPLAKVPKKTKQYGWQCTECDKGDPSQQPVIISQEIDLEAPRASRARGQTSRLSSVILSDSDAESIRNMQDVESVEKTPVKKSAKKIKTQKVVTPVESTPLPSCDITSSSQASSSLMSPSPVTPSSSSAAAVPSTPTTHVKTPKKRGRPVGWRKEKKEGDSSPTKVKKARKSKSTIASPVVSSTTPTTNPMPSSLLSIKEPVDLISTPPNVRNDSENNMVATNSNSKESPVSEVPNNLPPKKFFKSKAAQKENIELLPQQSSVSPPPNAENERTNFRNWLDAKLSPIKAVNNIDSEPQLAAKCNGVESEDITSSRNDASDDSSGDENEASPDKEKIKDDKEDKEARKERKRLKREEKEKRRQERKKKKLMKNQDTFSCNIVEAADIEEDEDSCVVRIAPKSIKIKIKPITKPDENGENSDFPVATSDDSPDKISNKKEADRSLSPVTNMHPKKKLAHMTDSLVNNFPVVNNLIHSTLPFLQPLPMSNNHHHKYPPLPQLPIMTNNKKPEHNNILATRNGIDHKPSVDDYEFTDDDSNKIINTPKPPASKPKKPNNENSGKKGRDVRTKCDVCLGEGTNANLVRCDECLKCYHFGCLNPPVKKTPKVSGWAWSCSDCAPSDEDKGWHL